MASTPEERALWEKTRIIARLWWCDDEVCDCTQPIVERVTPNREAGFPITHRERLWEGDFHSQRDGDEARKDTQDLQEAAERFGAELL